MYEAVPGSLLNDLANGSDAVMAWDLAQGSKLKTRIDTSFHIIAFTSKTFRDCQIRTGIRERQDTESKLGTAFATT